MIRPWRLSSILVVSFLLVLSSGSSLTYGATVVNASGYPWLVPGAFATYQYAAAGEPPAHVLSNGTVLLGVAPPPSSLHIGAWPPATGTANMTWTVLSRNGEMAQLNVSFESSGCEYSDSQAPCTAFNFHKSVRVSVNVTDGESYAEGQPQGRLNFWAPPLLVRGQLYLGSAFVGGSKIDSVGNISASPKTSFGGTPIQVSGSEVQPPYDTYFVAPTTLGYSLSNFRYAWENISLVNLNNPSGVSGLGPSGYYDYYTGLALYMSGPEYPIQQTVCKIASGELSNCRYVLFGTSLGQFFDTGDSSFQLVSTNIALSPVQTQPATGSGSNLVLIAVLAAIVIGGVGGAVILKAARKSSR